VLVLRDPPARRAYDAVGPETVSMLQLMENFAKLNGRGLQSFMVELNLSTFGTHTWIKLGYVGKDSLS
jgi:hypothetical protein